MVEDAVCAKCGSGKVLPYVDIHDHDHSIRRELSVAVHPTRTTSVFRGTIQGPLVARVCCGCGFAELYVKNPDELWKVANRP